MSKRRHYNCGLVHIIAFCHDCNKTWNSQNAHGVAVQHHDKTGHEVQVEACHAYVYLRVNKEKEEK